MPELPDVEGFRRTFDRYAAGKTVGSVHVDRGVARNATPQAIGRALKGRSLSRSDRKGKWLICATDGATLLLHFGMTGDLIWNAEDHPHNRMTLELDDGDLVFRDMRKLGGVWIARDAGELDQTLARVGPDAVKVSKKEFLERVSRRRGSIKSALMDQTVVSGLGNLTVDESLWRARIAPKRAAASLSDDELPALNRSVNSVLRSASKVGHVPGRRGWLTGARDRSGACPRCGARLERATVAGRTTYWCPSCQT